MSAYTKVGEITEAQCALYLFVVSLIDDGDVMGEWERCEGTHRNYSCYRFEQIMFVKIPPGGRVDQHRDKPAKGRRLNTVLQTNDLCLNHMGAITQHLEERGIYEFDATQEHWAENNGSVDRIVMVETLPYETGM